MKSSTKTRFLLAGIFVLSAGFGFDPAVASASPATGDGRYAYDDEYIRIDAGMVPGKTKDQVRIEVSLSPKQEWKLTANSSKKFRPLKLKLPPSKCYKTKGEPVFSQPDLSGTDDSGVYSEHYTKTATIRQDLVRLSCKQKKGADEIAPTVTYLLCQENRCIGPFSQEIRVTAPERN